VLAQIENADSAAQIAQANQSVAAAQADLEQYQNDLSKEKYKLKSLKCSDAASNDKNAQKAQIEASQNVVTAQQARVLAAQAGVKIAQAQLAKTIILAPFDGIIAKQDLQIGEIASPGKSTIKIVAANDTYEIEALASQQEIANIKIGDMANVTLDAYGKNENFAAKVSNIDLGATLQAGVSTYKVTLEFLQKDERIKSGMNANVTLKQ
jgi:multidrug resistance efflux pump